MLFSKFVNPALFKWIGILPGWFPVAVFGGGDLTEKFKKIDNLDDTASANQTNRKIYSSCKAVL